ncbi:MAG: uracil-DNA glycosylase family protein [Methanomicrobiales archaeon]
MSAPEISPRRERLEAIHGEIAGCTACPLALSRTHPVPGEGPPDARVMFVGEAPGRQEDEQGRPFVGRAGALLDELLDEAGFDRSEVFITNIVKCRPSGNRDPRRAEIGTCLPFLRRQIGVIGPRVIAPLGRVAAETVLSLFDLPVLRIGECHGRIFRTGTGVAIVPLYHPAAASYNRSLLPGMFEDIRAVRQEEK